MGLLFRVATLVLFAVTAIPADVSAESKLRIGAILPLTGEMAHWGKCARDAMVLALEEANARGENMSVIFEDDQSQVTKAVSAVHKLIASDRINAVITYSSGASSAVAPIAEEAKLVQIAIAIDPEVSRGRKYTFSFWLTPETEAQALAEEIKRRGYKRIAVFTTIQDGMLSLLDLMKKELSNGNSTSIVVDHQIPQHFDDFRSLATKLRTEKVDAAMLLLMPGHLGNLSRQLRQSGFSGDIFGPNIFEDPGEVQISGGALNGAWFSTGGDGREEFVSKYRSRFPDNVLAAACNAYDIIGLFESIVKTGEWNSDTAASYLNTLTNYEGACGNFSATGDQRFTLPAILKTVVDGEFVVTKQ